MSLFLTRCIGQKILIAMPGGPIVQATIARIRGNEVRIAFEAPPSVVIHRREVYDEVVKANGLPPLVALGPDSTDRVSPFTEGHTPASAGPDRA